MINTEKAFDLLPVLTDIFDKLNLKEYIAKLQKESKGKTKEALGVEMFKYFLKNSSNIKEEFFMLVAILKDKTPEEIKQQNIMDTISSIKEIFTDKEFMSFFTNLTKQEDTKKP